MKLNTKSIAIREYTGELQKSKANGDLSRFFLSFDIWNETTGLSRIRSMPNCARRIHWSHVWLDDPVTRSGSFFKILSCAFR